MKLTKEEELHITNMLNRTYVLNEMERIKKLEDFEQQGYELAPLICHLTGAPPCVLFQTTIADPGIGDNALRDAGVLRWCVEQSRSANDEQ